MYQVPKLIPSHHLDRHGKLEKVFSDEEIERITFFERILKLDDAMIGDGAVVEETRITKTGWIPIDQNTQFLYEKLAHIVGTINYDHFLYDIEWMENIQFTVYNGSEEGGGHYNWHRDSGLNGYAPYERKISGIIMLTDSDEYEGGELLVDVMGGNQDNALSVELNKGDLFFFDSSCHHIVKPVTKGTRKTLVFWVRGKNQLG
jgi:PKHD-type hydroxylase